MMIDAQQLTSLVLRAGSLATDRSLSSDITVKGDADFVTRADFAVQDFLRQELAAAYPQAVLVAEENETNLSASGAAFILDPIDGTTNLTHNFGQSAISLGYYENREGLFGAVYNPFTDELYTAERGQGAYCNGKRIHCSAVQRLADCLASVEPSPYYKESSDFTFELLHSVFSATQDIRVAGAAAIDLINVAAGRSDLFVSRLLKPWDYAAASVIITEAGGYISDFAGEKLPLDSNSNVLAAAPGVWEQLKTLITTHGFARTGAF